MYALDNCDDVAKAKAAVAAPQWIISNPNVNVFWNFFFLITRNFFGELLLLLYEIHLNQKLHFLY